MCENRSRDCWTHETGRWLENISRDPRNDEEMLSDRCERKTNRSEFGQNSALKIRRQPKALQTFSKG